MNNLDKIGGEIVANIKQRIDSNDISFSGNLKSSVHYVINDNRVDILMESYGKFINSGTKPHYLNSEGVKNVILWAESKGLPPWGVITNIRLYGTKAKPFLDDIENDIDEIVKRNLDDFFEYSSNIIYNKLVISLNKQ